MTKDMTQGSPLKLILAFAVPLMLGSLFQQFYNLADTDVYKRQVQHQTEPVVAADGHVIAAVGADVKAAGPDGAGGAAAALFALHELWFVPDGPGIPPGLELEGAFPHPAGEQVSDIVHGVLPQTCAVM